jgi:large subunit ribosomal protein L9
MRVILTHNVVKLGEVGDVCNVAPGYGRNYLIPQGLAIRATPGAIKQIDDLKRTEQRRQDKVRAEMTDFSKRIGNLHLSFTAKVGETGRLYGSITAANIADEVEAELGEPVDRRKIVLDESIRTLGSHIVPIHLMPGVDAEVHLDVVAHEEIVQDIGLTAELDADEEAEGDEETETEAGRDADWDESERGSEAYEAEPEAVATAPAADGEDLADVPDVPPAEAPAADEPQAPEE